MEIKLILEQQQELLDSQLTKTYDFRIKYLKRLKEVILKKEEEILNALNKDLSKGNFESYMTEVGMVLNELSYHIKKLKKWSRPKKVKTPLSNFRAKTYVYAEPYGKVLILAPWNYPFQLAISPLIGAIASGNTVIVKPSEISVNTQKIVNEIVDEVFEKNHVSCIIGDYKVANDLLDNKFDYIFFTGSTKVGKIVMQKAAVNLTPTTLELGGKSPLIINDTKKMDLVGRRVAFGKLLNSGQTCIAPDYLFIKKGLLKPFIASYDKAIKEFYGQNPIESTIYPKIINKVHHQRLLKYFDGSKILYGGEFNEEKIAPTIVEARLDHPVLNEEIFGPIIPVIEYESIDDVIKYILENEKPLAAYLFSNDKKIQKLVMNSISFGGATINDTIMHFTNHYVGFGGVGASGMGSYHGKKSFKTFSHFKPVVSRANWIDLKVRYLPESKLKTKIIRKLIK